MKKNELFVKTLKEVDGQQEYQTINLFDVLDNTEQTEPVTIVEDVILKKGKKQPLPKFNNIVLDSKSLDCGNYILSKDSVLPNGITELFCLYSINGLIDLIGILPPSLKKVHVRNNIFNQLKDSEKRKAAEEFIEKYPNVTVVDERNIELKDRLKNLEEVEKAAQESQLAKTKTKTNVSQKPTEVKTDNDMSADDFVKIVQDNNLIIGQDSDTLKRLFKIVRSQKSGLKIESYYRQREDGAIVVCVAKNKLSEIVECIQQKSAEQTKPKQSNKTVQSQEKHEEPTTVQQKTEPKKIFINGKEIKETKIE